MEMLIVLGILVMLVALVAPRFLGAAKKADIQAAQTQIGLFKGALEKYALDTKNFPTTEEGLRALFAPPSAGESGEGEGVSTGGWDGPYMDGDVPLDPWGNEYQYAYPPEKGTRDFPDIWSLGPDGEDGTEDDITNFGTVGGEGDEGDLGTPREPGGGVETVEVGGGGDFQPPAPRGGPPAGGPDF
jgi:general secretion pathway protein G